MSSLEERDPNTGQMCVVRKRWLVGLVLNGLDSSGESELGHANKLIHRIQQLEGFPQYQAVADVSRPLAKWDIGALLASDLEVEKEVLDSLAGLIEAAEQENDWETGNVLRGLVTDTEHHITWLSTQLALVEELGKASYLQAQL